MREPSKKADAVCHRERMSRNETFELLQKKLYLGRDTRHKLSLIAKKLTGAGFNPHTIDGEKAAHVISACVSHMYNELFDDNEENSVEGLEEHHKIAAATCQISMDIYAVYQRIRGRFDKLYFTGATDKERYDSVAEKLNECEVKKPRLKALSAGPKWTRSDVAWICNPANINECIERKNKKHAPLKLTRNASEL